MAHQPIVCLSTCVESTSVVQLFTRGYLLHHQSAFLKSPWSRGSPTFLLASGKARTKKALQAPQISTSYTYTQNQPDLSLTQIEPKAPYWFFASCTLMPTQTRREKTFYKTNQCPL
ncbi:unnamed protein product [Ectocarpus sp. 12 AP-2014]